MDELLKELGFSNITEFHELVANADISTPEKLAAFKTWQAEDGTKEGLLKLQRNAEGKPIQLDYQWSNSLDDIPPPVFGSS